MNKPSRKYVVTYLSLLVLLTQLAMKPAAPMRQADNPNPPQNVVKLIFIHHSTGENWLTDGYGDLGRTLDANNYFVSDTNYGWGPDSIGDRTDIPNWLEWFSSAETSRYMDALFNETEQHSSYTRTLGDPGGENTVILFKSCFPNSDLGGSADDPATPGMDLTVGNAKYVYNEILKYFATRPDKLFIVITQPPLSDPSHAANARAFTNWLTNDWLEENGYTQPNVAVFDFHNVLTAKDAHHRFVDGRIEHIVPARDTLYYPSGDDHPNEAGSRKATDEFVPLLNVFYQRWLASNPAEAAPVTPADPQRVNPAPEPASQASAALIDDFEGSIPEGTNGWEAYTDDAAPTTLSCAADGGSAAEGNASLLIEAELAPNSWATCNLSYGTAQDWSAYSGIQFQAQSGSSGQVLHVDLYSGNADNRESYVYLLDTSSFGEGWNTVSLVWEDFTRVEWEENAGEPFHDPAKILGLAFGYGSGDDGYQGEMRVDDLRLSGGSAEPAVPSAEQPPAAEPQAEQPAEEPDEDEGSGIRNLIPCGGALVFPMLFLLFAVLYRKTVSSIE